MNSAAGMSRQDPSLVRTEGTHQQHQMGAAAGMWKHYLSLPRTKPTHQQDQVGAENDLQDVLIVGGGPAGLSAAIYATRAGLKTLLLDKNQMAGALALAERIENYPGLGAPVKGVELLSIFRSQAERFGARVLQAQVIGAVLSKDPKEIMTFDAVYLGRTVIIATGSMGRKPSIKGEEGFIGKGVSYCAACDAPFFKGRTVAVVGEMDKVRDEVETILRFASRVVLVSPRKLEHEMPRVDVLAGHRVLEIRGARTVEGLRTIDADGREHDIEASGIFIFLHGTKPVTDYLGEQVETTPEGCVKVREDCSTSVDGVFAAGDVTCPQTRQVVIAAADGCIAALSAERYLHRRKRAAAQWG
ncbi:MAG: FAD-dependent oxidoreductase [Candidatus Thermoplasmatota archaeon]